jgi:hypothetical protein
MRTTCMAKATVDSKCPNKPSFVPKMVASVTSTDYRKIAGNIEEHTAATNRKATRQLNGGA